MSVAPTNRMLNGLHVPIPAIPWLAAMLLGASAHVGWLTHDCASTRVAVPPPRVVVAEIGAPQEIDATPMVPAQANLRTSAAHKGPAPQPRVLRCTAERDCSISRADFDRYLQRPEQLARDARLVPSIRDGRQVGFKIYGVRRYSMAKQLGLRNGDLLISLNGHTLGSIDHTMSTYRETGKATVPAVVRFGLERKGEPVEILLRIRGEGRSAREPSPAD